MSSKKLQMPRKFVKPPKRKNDEEERQQDDHELFLTAFEKPTQIYRYLETRHEESPIFLHRNLSYLEGYRMSRKKNTRNISLEYMIDKLNHFHKESQPFLNLKYVGFFDKTSKSQESTVEMETYLIKTSANKETTRILIGNYKIPLNPKETNHRKEEHEVNIFIDDLKNERNNNNNCTCALQFKVKLANSKFRTRYGRPAKVPKTSTSTIYSNEIVIGTNSNILLTDGLYEISFEENSNKENQLAFSNNCEWKSKIIDQGKALNFSACLRFHLTLTGLSLKRKDTRIKTKERYNLTKPIIFQFLYGKYSQKTDASMVPNCPWCTLDCGSLYSLLKHLRCCHDRLSFKYTKTAKEHRISVIVNGFTSDSCQDDDNPHEFDFTRSCLASGPKRKYPRTKILVLNKNQAKKRHDSINNNMSEFAKFTEYHHDVVCHPRYVEPHHRLYNHSVTGVPKYPQELEEDSEEELDPLWLRDSVTKMVDAFRDVNEGEKEIMKMWNLHVLKYGFVGNCHMELACNKFVEEKGDEVIEKNLYRNFLVHLTNLVDFEVISGSVLSSTVKKLQEKLKDCSREELCKMLEPVNDNCSKIKVLTKEFKKGREPSVPCRRSLRRKTVCI